MAGESCTTVTLAQHADFVQAILFAAEHFRASGLRPAWIEKDYYVTEALRTIAGAAEDSILFKGGTSLSKGWGLINRFSEDIDLFLDPDAYSPRLGKNGIDRESKRLRDAVTRRTGLQYVPEESRTVGGFGRSDRFQYDQKLNAPGEIAGTLLIEMGTGSGRQPWERVNLQSLLSQYLMETGQSLGADDETPFSMRLLHFRRTFVEKLFAIHSKVELTKRDSVPIGSHARHYYDLFQLSSTPSVKEMLDSTEFAEIKLDYDRISKTFFSRDYHPPNDLLFAHSEALFPSDALSKRLEAEYERQCRLLCFGKYPTWSQVRSRFDELRDHL
jgi:predicted nucleotidyltransferase component of viral defense system